MVQRKWDHHPEDAGGQGEREGGRERGRERGRESREQLTEVLGVGSVVGGQG